MMKFTVTTEETVLVVYEIEADSKLEAAGRAKATMNGFQDGVRKISSEAFLIGVLSAEPEGSDKPDQDGPGGTYDEWQARWEEDCPDG